MNFRVLKKRVLYILVLFCFLGVQANADVPKEKEDRKTMFKNEVAISTFPDWLANQLLHRHIPFRVNLAESDYLFNRLAYADTLSRDVDLLTRFTVTKSGKIKNCVIENLTDEEFTDEVRRVVSISGKWKAAKVDGKKEATNQQFTIPLDLKGEVAVLDKVPEWGEADKRIYDKRYNLTRYIHQVAMHVYDKSVDTVRVIEFPKVNMAVLGTLKLSFIVDEEGYFSDLRYVNDLPSSAQFDYFVTRQMYPGRFFSNEVKWKPAMIDGKPVKVLVKAVIDYDKKEFSWDCFLIN